MTEIPPEEQYETDTIFSQDGDVPDSYLQTRLYELESESEVFSDGENNMRNDQFITIDLPSPTTRIDSDSFIKLVEESKFTWASSQGASTEFDKIVFEDEVYDMSQDSFRYGRVTTGTSYNLVTGRMKDQVMEKVKEKDEDDDELVETVTEDETTHLITTEVTISLNGNGDEKEMSAFDELFNSQMPKFFKYRDAFPEIRGIWTLLFDQEHYGDMSTFELQASICAALNSKHQLIICIGVDNYNSVTGVEMSATDRVVFRMALTRAVAGEFQPPLIKVPPKQLTGVSPMKRDVSEMTSLIDVLFIPVLKDSVASGDCPTSSRFLIVVRVKETTEKLYQLSSGRIYVEENGRVVELSSINEAFCLLITKKNPEHKPSFGSIFMLEPEPFVEESQLEIDECSSEEDEIMEITDETKPNVIEADVQEIVIPPEENQKQLSNQVSIIKESVLSHLDTPHAQNIGWLLFATAVAYGIYQTVRTRF
uniref:Copine domain-containing protein n=1 Tax=Caenorhabditis tropicalis TaxID=1561998 RepID=A0A1I7U7V6_9PELO